MSDQHQYHGVFNHQQMTAEVAVAYRLSELGLLLDPDKTPAKRDMDEVDTEFKKWLAQERRQAAAQGWEEGEAATLHRLGMRPGYTRPDLNPHRSKP